MSPPPVVRSVHRACLADPVVSETSVFSEWNAAFSESVAAGRLLTVSLFRDGRSLFLYTESIGGPLPATELPRATPGFFQPWPEADGNAEWVLMPEVFHFNEPASLEHWRRTSPPVERQGRLLRLRPDKVASYVYYHYQLQEERAFAGEKYKWIGLHGTLLFMYNELPATIELPSLPGRLLTKGTPPNWADAGMDQHFIPWDERTPYSRGLPCVFSL